MEVFVLILLLVSVLLEFASAAIERNTEKMIQDFCKEQKQRENKD
jgi:hypothetical protein